MRRLFLCLTFILFCTSAVALEFPALTGRVVDTAHILSPATVRNLEQTLEAYEQQSTNQVVVATIPSLEGQEIEEYGYRLGRHWGIGQKDKNNGVLLIVAPQERRVRIEVGYGLEGTLTDALSSRIIQQEILPWFRKGQMEMGIKQGAYAIISTLGGKIDANQRHKPPMQEQLTWGDGFHFFLFIAFILLRIFILPWWFPALFYRGGSGSGFSGGGFRGGGGSFGGGGASGGW